MATIIRQTIIQKQFSFWKLLCMIVGAVFIMNMAIRIFSKINPIVGTVGGLAAFIGSVLGCVLLIYKRLAHYNYRLIGDELFMERVIGRANHLFLSLKLSELDQFMTYEEMMAGEKDNTPTKLYKFVSSGNTQSWYVGEFTKNGSRYRFIIEPNKELLNAITSFVTK